MNNPRTYTDVNRGFRSALLSQSDDRLLRYSIQHRENKGIQFHALSKKINEAEAESTLARLSQGEICKTFFEVLKLKYRHLYEEICSDENIYKAYLNARKNKRYRTDVMLYTKNLEQNLSNLKEKLINKTITYPRYKRFIIHDPKYRVILSQEFETNVEDWAFYQVINPLLINGYIEHSYACIPGRGQIKAVLKLHEWLRYVNRYRYRREKEGKSVRDEDKWYYLKLDFSKYFYRIDHEIMKKRIKKKITDKQVQKWLFSKVDNPYERFGLPAGKKPEEVPPEEWLSDKGMPIGTLISQMLANLYNDVLDQCCKRELRIRYYIRYQDDIIILSNSKKQLHEWHRKIEQFANEEMKMELNSKTCIRPISLGVDFCGYKNYPTHIKIRKSTTKRMKRRLKKLMKDYNNGYVTLEHARSTIDSYMGLLKHCNSHSLKNKIFGDYYNVEGWFVLTKNKDDEGDN